MIIVCADVTSVMLLIPRTVNRRTRAVVPRMPVSWHHNDVTSFQDEICLQVSTPNDVCVRHWNHDLPCYSLPVLDVAENMNIITGGEQCEPAGIGYSLEDTGIRLENMLPRPGDFAYHEEMIAIDLFDLNRHSRRRHVFSQSIGDLFRKSLGRQICCSDITDQRQRNLPVRPDDHFL